MTNINQGAVSATQTTKLSLVSTPDGVMQMYRTYHS